MKQVNLRILILILENRDVVDEYHYILSCSEFTKVRKKFIPEYYYKHPNVIKYKELMQTTDINILNKIALFAKYLMGTIKSWFKINPP